MRLTIHRTRIKIWSTRVSALFCRTSRTSTYCLPDFHFDSELTGGKMVAGISIIKSNIYDNLLKDRGKQKVRVFDVLLCDSLPKEWAEREGKGPKKRVRTSEGSGRLNPKPWPTRKLSARCALTDEYWQLVHKKNSNLKVTVYYSIYSKQLSATANKSSGHRHISISPNSHRDCIHTFRQKCCLVVEVM